MQRSLLNIFTLAYQPHFPTFECYKGRKVFVRKFDKLLVACIVKNKLRAQLRPLGVYLSHIIKLSRMTKDNQVSTVRLGACNTRKVLLHFSVSLRLVLMLCVENNFVKMAKIITNVVRSLKSDKCLLTT